LFAVSDGDDHPAGRITYTIPPEPDPAGTRYPRALELLAILTVSAAVL